MNLLEAISTDHRTLNAFTLRLSVFVVESCLVPDLPG